jgi:hypothetical protein
MDAGVETTTTCKTVYQSFESTPCEHCSPTLTIGCTQASRLAPSFNFAAAQQRLQEHHPADMPIKARADGPVLAQAVLMQRAST